MNIDIDNLWVIQIGGVDVWITRTIFNTWLIMLALIAFAVFARIMLRKFSEVPRGFQNAIEAIVELFDNFLLSSVGERLMPIGTWFFSAFTFILISNISGVVGLRPPTADWATTFAFAFATFLFIQYYGMKYQKGRYLKSFFQPHPIFFPLNFIGELARPVSLSFRLYGNMLAGMILMTMVYSLTPVFVRFFIPVFLHAYFDLITGALQTYIFCILSLMFIRGATQ